MCLWYKLHCLATLLQQLMGMSTPFSPKKGMVSCCCNRILYNMYSKSSDQSMHTVYVLISPSQMSLLALVQEVKCLFWLLYMCDQIFPEYFTKMQFLWEQNRAEWSVQGEIHWESCPIRAHAIPLPRSCCLAGGVNLSLLRSQPKKLYLSQAWRMQSARQCVS